MEDLVALGGSLTHVTCLSLDEQYPALAGELGPDVEKLVNLEALHLQGARLGRIPDEIGKLTKLKLLWLPNNQLEGGIPTSLSKLGQLTSLNLNRNRLTGTLSPQLFQGPMGQYLQNLEVWKNKLSGPVPDMIERLVNLEYLWLNDNAFTGQLPHAIQKLVSLKKLMVGGNEMHGEIPDLGSLKPLESLYVVSKYTCGNAPSYSLAARGHTDLPNPGDEIISCDAIVTPAPTNAPSPATPAPSTSAPVPGGGSSPTPTIAPSVERSAGAKLDIVPVIQLLVFLLCRFT